ncbi:MAG: hypothetical protein FJ280_17235 [Planctomycetes bacterium]|nr:hypothetical protein [Planctomycetota bacterium]
MAIEPTVTMEFGRYLHAFLVEAPALVAVGCTLSLIITSLWFVVVMRCLGSGQEGSGGDRY